MSAIRVHVHMSVPDLEESKAFYRKFLGVTPVKERPGYAKFLPEFGPLNLALSQAALDEHEHCRGGAAPLPGRPGPVSHLGIQVDSARVVGEQLTRIKASGLSVIEEMGVNCCYANQDKFWVEDPDGVRWEVYHLNYDLEGRGDVEGRSLPSECCAARQGAVSPPSSLRGRQE